MPLCIKRDPNATGVSLSHPVWGQNSGFPRKCKLFLLLGLQPPWWDLQALSPCKDLSPAISKTLRETTQVSMGSSCHFLEPLHPGLVKARKMSRHCWECLPAPLLLQ